MSFDQDLASALAAGLVKVGLAGTEVAATRYTTVVATVLAELNRAGWVLSDAGRPARFAAGTVWDEVSDEVRDDGCGARWRRTVARTAWRFDGRHDCYCCSCPDGAIDMFCRNHGGAHGQRPCAVHNMPGDVCSPEDGCGCGGFPMPDPVRRQCAQHTWPDRLRPGTCCQACGLTYSEWEAA